MSSTFLSERPGNGTAWIVVGVPREAYGRVCGLSKTGIFSGLADGVRKEGLQEKQMARTLQKSIAQSNDAGYAPDLNVDQGDQPTLLYAVTVGCVQGVSHRC